MTAPIAVFGPPAGNVRVVIRGESRLPESQAVERDWSERCARNPKLHDGPVLHVERFDPTTGEIVCSRSSYKAFVAGHLASFRIESLGITGICFRRRSGGEEILVGRRAMGVRIYAGLWETAPRGAVEAPRAAAVLEWSDLAACLAVEAREELGASVRVGACVGFVRDEAASSLDLCVRCEIDGTIRGGNWEYQDIAWVPESAMAGWARGSPPSRWSGSALSPPCAAWFASRPA